LAILGAPSRSPDDDLVSFEPHHGVTPFLRVALALAVVVDLPVVPGPEPHRAPQAVARFKKLPQRFPRNPPRLLQAKSGRWIPGRIAGRIILDQGFQQVSLWTSAGIGSVSIFSRHLSTCHSRLRGNDGSTNCRGNFRVTQYPSVRLSRDRHVASIVTVLYTSSAESRRASRIGPWQHTL